MPAFSQPESDFDASFASEMSAIPATRALTLLLFVFLSSALSGCETRGKIYGDDPYRVGQAVLSSDDRTLSISMDGALYIGAVKVDKSMPYWDAFSHVLAPNGDWMDCSFRNTGLATFGEEWQGGCKNSKGTTLWLQLGSHVHT